MKKYFFTGLAILLPIALTLLIVGFVVNFLTKPFLGIFQSLIPIDKNQQIYRYLVEFLILIMLFALTVCLGYLTRWFVVKYLLSIGDYILHRIPFINAIYKTSQEVIKTIFSSSGQSFKHVVLIEFPMKGVYTMGFLSQESPASFCAITGKQMSSVFVPTTPNPTTGFLLMIPQEEIRVLKDISVEDALKFIISCGVINPDTNKTQLQPTP